MAAGVGKTDPALILPISLNILSGTHLGAGCIEEGMLFFSKHINTNSEIIVQSIVDKNKRPEEGDWHPIPGFGSRFGGRDLIPHKIANLLCRQSGAGAALHWGETLAASLQPHGMGWLVTGIAAATFVDLGFHPSVGPGLFQLLSAPGLLAHGVELSDKPFSAMPFLSDKDYLIEDDNG
jgi:citrate synthase